MFSNIKAARLLGWTSLAVGLTEIVATRWLEDELGVDDQKTLIRSFGVREIAAGVTILAQPGLNRTLANGLWSRVAGDAMDLTALGEASRSTQNPAGLGWITAVVLAVTGLDVLMAVRVQSDLTRASTISKRARQNVRPSNANPNLSFQSGSESAAAQSVPALQ